MQNVSFTESAFQETADCLKVVLGDLLYGIEQSGSVK